MSPKGSKKIPPMGVFGRNIFWLRQKNTPYGSDFEDNLAPSGLNYHGFGGNRAKYPRFRGLFHDTPSWNSISKLNFMMSRRQKMREFTPFRAKLSPFGLNFGDFRPISGKSSSKFMMWCRQFISNLAQNSHKMAILSNIWPKIEDFRPEMVKFSENPEKWDFI